LAVNSWRLTKGVAGRLIPDFLLGLNEQPDGNQQLTHNLRNFLSNLAKGEEAPLMTPGLRAMLGSDRKASIAGRLKELKSFTFLICDEMQGRVVEQLGAQISRTCYYKMITGSEARYYLFRLTSDGKVAAFGSFTE
jgi:hypothetical protein